MKNPAKIALQVPHPVRTDRYFTFKLKEKLENEPSVYPGGKRIFVVSDIEGNFQPLCKLLYKAKIIDKSFRWIFDDNHLVILGDCFDRGEQVIECLWLIYSLETKARVHGGRVHFILGNHEIMNLNGDWRYVHPKYADTFTAGKMPPAAIYNGNNELWNWLHTKNIIEKIGRTLFVHGGIPPQITQSSLSIPEINELARSHYNYAGEEFAHPLLALIFNSNDSPFWFRGYYQGAVTENDIDATLARFDVSTIVTGHTLVNQISSFYNGKVINVDTAHAAGRSEGLMITDKRFFRILMEGKRVKVTRDRG